jgi:hypothetical protein
MKELLSFLKGQVEGNIEDKDWNTLCTGLSSKVLDQLKGSSRTIIKVDTFSLSYKNITNSIIPRAPPLLNSIGYYLSSRITFRFLAIKE